MEFSPFDLHATLAALAAPRRFDLLVLMLAGEDRSVTQLAQAVGLSQSCTTRHLQALARAGLVKGVRDGKRVVFRIAPRDAAARAVLASLAGGATRPPSAGTSRTARTTRRQRPRRPAAGGTGGSNVRAQRRKLLESAVRIETAAELEPFMASDAHSPAEIDDRQRPVPESGRTSEPEAVPAWRRSDLEDFLL